MFSKSRSFDLILKIAFPVVLSYLAINYFFAPHQSTSLRDQPNIILVLMDDLGYETAIQGDSMVGIGMSKPLIVPMMRDSLPPKCITFTNAYSSPVCTPSRIQMMTGQYLYKSYQQFGQANWNIRTMAQNLLWNGYNTAVCGKWQLQGNIAFNSPSKFESDYSTINIENPRRLGYNEFLLHAVKQNGQIYSNCSNFFYENNTQACTQGDYGPYLILDYFKDFVNRNKDGNRPFFIDYRMLLPHDPFHPVPSHIDYPNDTINNARYLPEMITLTDSIIGAIIDHVEKTPELHEGAGTAVIVYSDNGSSRGWITNNPEGNPVTSWGIFTKINGIGEYNGNKSLSTYLGTHVPAFAYYVGPHKNYEANEIYSDPIGLIDIYSTVMDLAKLWSQSPRDGKSFADEIVDYVPDKTNRSYLVQYYHPFFESVSALRNGTNVNSFITDGNFWLDSRDRFYNLVDDLDWELLNSITPSSEEEIEAYTVFDSILQTYPAAEEFNKPLVIPN